MRKDLSNPPLRTYLYNPHLSGDLGQGGVEVVGAQGLPPHGLVFVGSNPAHNKEEESELVSLDVGH